MDHSESTTTDLQALARVLDSARVNIRVAEITEIAETADYNLSSARQKCELLSGVLVTEVAEASRTREDLALGVSELRIALEALDS